MGSLYLLLFPFWWFWPASPFGLMFSGETSGPSCRTPSLRSRREDKFRTLNEGQQIAISLQAMVAFPQQLKAMDMVSPQSCGSTRGLSVYPHCDTRESPRLWEALSVESQKWSFPTALPCPDRREACQTGVRKRAGTSRFLALSVSPTSSFHGAHGTMPTQATSQVATLWWHFISVFPP